ncbi:MAG: imidazole glycerol phosphate synthase subunit HisH [Gammaproteobacteria bacterium]|nr:imidazole glycerol phosphate synthase subunit HisH [Gammaproteobacteria bacterium]RCL41292.1 MAG: imidazole glycerol phosphate synthase subunit HisH [Gammaproteobacteria bacterium]
MKKKTVILDYGMGNLFSVLNAIKYLNFPVEISNNPSEILKADSIILPGVGSFKKAMSSLNNNGFIDVLKESVLEKQKNILGICLGMQLFASEGEEDGFSKGLGFIDGRVKRMIIPDNEKLKLPHIGFNTVSFDKKSILGNHIDNNSDFYFVHSYHLFHKEVNLIEAKCEYGIKFTAAYERDNIFATQFHPEKSQTNGLQLLKNFLEI